MYTLLNYFISIANSSNNQDMNYHIAKYLMDYYMQIETMTLQEIADACYVSVPSVKNFFKQFGFSNFTLVKKRILQDQRIRKTQIQRFYEQVDVEHLQAAMLSLSACDQMELFLQKHKLYHIVDAIAQSERILVFGSLSFTQLLVNFQTDLIVMGKKIIVSSLVEENLAKIEPNDLVMIISGSGRILFHEQMIERMQAIKNPVVVISGDHESIYAFTIMEKIFLWAKNEMFDAEHLVLFYFDMLRILYYQKYGKERLYDC